MHIHYSYNSLCSVWLPRNWKKRKENLESWNSHPNCKPALNRIPWFHFSLHNFSGIKQNRSIAILSYYYLTNLFLSSWKAYLTHGESRETLHKDEKSLWNDSNPTQIKKFPLEFQPDHQKKKGGKSHHQARKRYPHIFTDTKRFLMDWVGLQRETKTNHKETRTLTFFFISMCFWSFKEGPLWSWDVKQK